METIQTLYTTWRFRRQQKQHRLAQGQLTPDEAATQLAGEGHIPLAVVGDNPNETTLFIPPEDEGHLLLVAPPDSGWQEHLLQILIHWPGAALIIDPEGTLYQQTGYFRETLWDKVYALPGYRFNLARYYPFWDADAAKQLHRFLVPPGPADEAWLRSRSVSLLQALGHLSFARKLNPMHLLLDAANTDLLRVLAALDGVPAARHQVLIFTKGQPVKQALADPDVVRSFDLFCRALAPYQSLYPYFSLEHSEELLPHDWLMQTRSLYVTYPYAQQIAMAGITAALIEGVRQYYHSFGQFKKLLLILPADIAQRLPPLEQVLTEAAAYGIRVVLTAPSLAALDALVADGDGAALAGRFAHQVWYPPNDQATACQMSWLYGTALPKPGGPAGTVDGGEKAALAPEMFLAWPREQVLVYTRRERPYRFVARRMKRPSNLPERPAPVPPKVVATPRDPSAWLSYFVEAVPFLLPDIDTLLERDAPAKRKKVKTAVSDPPALKDQSSQISTVSPLTDEANEDSGIVTDSSKKEEPSQKSQSPNETKLR